MKRFKVIKIQFQTDKGVILKCTYCGSERLHSIGDVLQCVDCKGVRALK